MKKADTQESNRRVAQISEMLLDGESYQQIIQYCSDTWNIGERQVYNYIQKARSKWDEICNKQFESNLNWHLLTRGRLYQKCIKKEDFSNARQTLNDLADIQGISRNRVEHTGKDGGEILIREIVVNRETANTDKE
jgi:hypothetical protein